MESIKINGKEYELNYGIRFSRALSKVYYMERNVEGNSLKFGLGVRMVVGYLETGDEDAIFETIKAAMAKHKKKPSDEELMDALDELAMEKGGFGEIADELLDAMRDSGFYQKAFEETEEAEKKAKK